MQINIEKRNIINIMNRVYLFPFLRYNLPHLQELIYPIHNKIHFSTSLNMFIPGFLILL